MECEDGNNMRKKIISNLISSGVEKFFLIGVQFIASIILIRLLPREEYGIIGVVAGYYAFVNFINISMESIILRDHGKFDENLQRTMYSFFIFNLAKSTLFLILAIVLALFLSTIYARYEFVYAIFSITFILIADSMTAPLSIYAATKFNQKLVTKISMIRAGLNLVFLGGIFFWPTLAFIACKDFVVSLVFVAIWFVVVCKRMSVSFSFRQSGDWAFIRDSFVSYSLWTHLNGVVTNVIYRSDTFFLSLFAGLSSVGDYNIALNSANIANILPMIIGYQNSVALSHAKDKNHIFIISNSFIVLSLALGAITLVSFAICGHWYLELLTGQVFTGDIFFNMMCIVTGLVIVKSFASPLVSFLNIHGSVQKIVLHITLPTLLFALPLYYFGAYFFQSRGLALSNVIISIIWRLFLFI